MTLVKKVREFLKAKFAESQIFEFFELRYDINRVFRTILELYFPKRAPKVCAPNRHTASPQISEQATRKPYFRLFFDQELFLVGAFWGAALFVKETFILGSKHISIPAPNSKNFKSYVQLKISKFLDFELFGPGIVGKSVIFFTPKTFSENFRQKSKFCQNIVAKYRLSTKLKLQRIQNIQNAYMYRYESKLEKWETDFVILTKFLKGIPLRNFAQITKNKPKTDTQFSILLPQRFV